MTKNTMKLDEISALIEKMRDGELEINWEILLQAVAQWKGEKEANKMRKANVTYVELAPNSYHHCGYDNHDPWYSYGYTYVREPNQGDRTTYADWPVTHIEVRPDVVIKFNDANGAAVEWSFNQPCPFVFIRDI